MTQEDKDLLLIDLCARLPYGVFIHYHWSREGNTIDEDRELDFSDVETLKYDIENPQNDWCEISWKPYLRPMSSMTEEEREEIEVFIFNEWYQEDCCKIDNEGWIEILANYDVSGIDPCFCADYVDWLNEHHFDYRGLIEKGLAIEAPEGMYKNAK